MTTVNCEKKDGFVSIKVAGDSSTNLALTASFSSCRNEHMDLALGCPKHPSSTECKYKVPEYKFHHFGGNARQKNMKNQSTELTQKIISQIRCFNRGVINNSDTSDSSKH
jgi:hypothetical protein